MSKEPKNLRNIAVIAQGGAGKTKLIEMLLFQAQEISAVGSKKKGTTVMSVEPEEVERGIAITPHVGHFTWNDVNVNLLDTPGYFNFLESSRGVLPGADGAIILFSGVDGVKPEAERLWSMLVEAEVPTIGFINMMDVEEADFVKTLSEIETNLEIPSIALTLPVGMRSELPGIVDLLRLRAWSTQGGKSKEIDIPDGVQSQVETLRTQLIERIAEADDELVERYLEGEELSIEELEQGLKAAITKREFIPVLCGSALGNVGIDTLIEAMVNYLPSPLERDNLRPVKGRDPNSAEEVEKIAVCDPSGSLAALVLKTTIDPFSGKLSVVRVFSGEITSNQTLLNANQNQKEKTGHLYIMQGKELQQVESLKAGEIGALAKLEQTHTGDTLCDARESIVFPPVKFADPPISYAVEAEAKSEEKVASGLSKLVDEDPTLQLYRDEQTHQMILAGMGQTHLEVALERLTRKFGGKAILKTPQVPYRETIRKKVKVQGKLKKQTGGHGQFANCWIEVEPLPRDGGFEFADLIVGGVIPKQFIPSVKKGVMDSMLKGTLGGFPVVDVKVSLVDGSFHSVDSSDFAFQTAGSMAFKSALEEASPVLLEPIMLMEIIVPEETTGDIIKDASSRRGKVLGMDTKGDKQKIKAEIPLAEVLEYGNILNAITSGRGLYTMSVSSYQEVPDSIAEKTLEALKAAQSEE